MIDRAVLLAVLLASTGVAAQPCRSPQDTRCSPQDWLNPVFGNSQWWSQAGQVTRAGQLQQCIRIYGYGPPPPASWCAAAMAGARRQGGYFAR